MSRRNKNHVENLPIHSLSIQDPTEGYHDQYEQYVDESNYRQYDPHDAYLAPQHGQHDDGDDPSSSLSPAARDFLDLVTSGASMTVGEDGRGEQQYFVSLEVLKEFWTLKRIRELLEPMLVKRANIEDVPQRFLRIFSTLVYISTDGAYPFYGDIVYFLESNVDDNYLPFQAATATGLPPHPFERLQDSTHRKFVLEGFQLSQWLFCPAEFRPYPHKRILPPECVLPIDVGTGEEGEAEEAAQSWVYSTFNTTIPGIRYRKVKLHKASKLQTPQVLFKCYDLQDNGRSEHFDREVATLSLLTRRNRDAGKYFPECYGSFLQANLCTIMLQLPQWTLLSFFEKHRFPRQPAEMMELWLALTNLFRGLDIIHTRSGTQGAISGSVRPSSIFVYQGSSGSEFDLQFKLADFRLSTLVKLHPEESFSPDHREQDPDYTAPESGMRKMRNLSPPTDIWALGCVLVEAALWTLNGEEGRQALRGKRAGRGPSDSTTSVNSVQRPKGVVKFLTTIDNTFDTVSKSGYAPVIREKMSQVKQMIVDNMLTPRPEDRMPAEGLFHMFKNLFPPLAITQSFSSPDSASTSVMRPQSTAASPRKTMSIRERPVPGGSKPKLSRNPDVESRGEPTPEQYEQRFSMPPRRPSTSSEMSFIGRGNPAGSHTSTDLYVHEPSLEESNYGIWRSSSSSTAQRSTESLSYSGQGYPHGRGNPLRDDVYAKRRPGRIPEQVGGGSAGYDSSHVDSFGRPLSGGSFSTGLTVDNTFDLMNGPQYPGLDTHPAFANRLGKLGSRDQFIIVDEAESMQYHWPEVKKTLKVLTYIAKGAGADIVEIRFTSDSEKTISGFSKGLKRLHAAVDEMEISRDLRNQPADLIVRSVEQLFSDITKPKKKKGSVFGRTPSLTKKASGKANKESQSFSLYILTDGQWEMAGEANIIDHVFDELGKFVEALHSRGFGAEDIFIQLIQFGRDPQESKKLRLAAELTNVRFDDPCVHTSHSNGDVWGILTGETGE